MTEVSVPLQVPPDEELLDFTQRARLRLLDKLHPEGADPDIKAVPVIVQVLDSMDKQVIGKRRIAAQEKTNDSLAVAAAAIIQVFNGEAGQAPKSTRVRTEPIEVGPLVAEVTMVPGEMDCGVSTVTYSEFFAEKDE